ncbi:MAG TPA: DUF3105 domain-containing protein [Actinomycetota bacterium]|nr:DUF3105 domain-containing protein [Actinomycetota bacterium]
MSNDAPRRPGEGRRLTKAERKEQARREREDLQRKLASKRRARTVGMAAGGAVIAAVVAAATLLPSGGDLPEPAQLLQRASAAATEAGCGEVATTPDHDPVENDRSHMTTGQIEPLSSYPTIPPASGPHADVPLPAGVYDSLTQPQLYQAIHSLEHGATIVWYDPAAPAARTAEIIDFYDRRLQDAQVGQDRVIVAPYDFLGDPAGILPEGTQMALASWHRLRSCAAIDLAVAFDFTSEYSFPTAEDREYAGVAPEPGGSLG